MPGLSKLFSLDRNSSSGFAAMRSKQIVHTMYFTDIELGRVMVKSAVGLNDKECEPYWKFTTAGCESESIDHVAVALYEVGRDKIAYWWIRPAGLINKRRTTQTIKFRHLRPNSSGQDIVLQLWMKLDV